MKRQTLFVAAVFGLMLFGLLSSILVAEVVFASFSQSLAMIALVFLVCLVGFTGGLLLYIEGWYRLHARFTKLFDHIYAYFAAFLLNALIVYWISVRFWPAYDQFWFECIVGISIILFVFIMVFEVLAHRHSPLSHILLIISELFAWGVTVGFAYLIAIDFLLIFGWLSLLF